MSDGGDRFATVTRGIIIAAAAVAGMAMVVVALWAWQGSVDMVADWDVLRPGAVVWAIRCGAIASAALAQVVILGGVAGQIFPRRSADQAAIIAAAGICLSAIVGGTILAAVGR